MLFNVMGVSRVCMCVCWEVLGLVSTEAGAVGQMREICVSPRPPLGLICRDM